MKKIIVALSLCLALLLGVCVYLELGQEAPPAPPQPDTCTVTFQILGTTVSTQTVAEGGLPERFTQTLPGVRFAGWMDENGNAVDPFTAAVTADTVYTAEAYPELAAHTPFLFPDHNGLLRPDEPLTPTDLKAALVTLAAPGADAYFPELDTGRDPITREGFTGPLTCVFGAEAVAAAFGDAQTLTRGEFAIAMHTLLGKDTAERVILLDTSGFPTDITAERADAVYLLEASVPHAPSDGGILWSEMELPTTHEPGFLHMDGWLYYVQEDGYLLRDGNVGELTFGPDGRYTCGDPVLDQTVAMLLGEFIRQNPEATRFELLRMAFDYCHQTFGYRRSWDDHPAKGSHGWEVQRAKDMFESGKGNCYGFAAAFWALARGLGYEARAISGVVLSDEQPHSWCFIEFDGKDYIFDPQWQFDYTRREIYDYDMFYLPSDDIYFWGYQWFE